MRKKYQLAYYAHSIKKYNTEQETLEYQFAKDMFHGFVICPNKHMEDVRIIEPYLDIVERVDVVYASEYNGCVGMGVFKECERALKFGIPVFVIKPSGVTFELEELISVDRIENGSLIMFGKLVSKKLSPKKVGAEKT